jgi:5-methyltetrahydropteroyltriglutamate--homocysteine methyltransferase
MRIDGRLGVSETIFGDAFEFLQSCVSADQAPKLTIPSPSMVHYRGGRASIDQSVYPNMDGFWTDLVAAYREEARRLGEFGCTYLQFDDTRLAYLDDPKQREYVREIGGDAEHQHEAYISHINEALADRPEGMSVTTHMCRGNFRSCLGGRGGLRLRRGGAVHRARRRRVLHGVGRRVLGRLRAAAFPAQGHVVVLGLVTTKRGDLEDRDLLKRRIEEASRYADLDQLCLSPQCGFSSTVEGNLLSHEEQAEKLRVIVEVADEVWG